MKPHRPLSADSLPAIAAAPEPNGAEVALPPAGPDRREFICGAMLAGTAVVVGWPAFGGAEEADWSDGTAWSDGRGWSS